MLCSHEINMTKKLESRPVQGSPWGGDVLPGCLRQPADPGHAGRPAGADQDHPHIKVLGCYPSEDVKPTAVPPVLMGKLMGRILPLPHKASPGSPLCSLRPPGRRARSRPSLPGVKPPSPSLAVGILALLSFHSPSGHLPPVAASFLPPAGPFYRLNFI